MKKRYQINNFFYFLRSFLLGKKASISLPKIITEAAISPKNMPQVGIGCSVIKKCIILTKTKKMSKLRRISCVRLDDDNEDDAGVLNQSNDNSTVEFIKNAFIMFAFGITIGCVIGKKVL